MEPGQGVRAPRSATRGRALATRGVRSPWWKRLCSVARGRSSAAPAAS